MPRSYNFSVCVHRNMDAWMDGDHLAINLKHLWGVYQRIGGTALVLYLYLYSHPNGTILNISARTVSARIGMPESTYRNQAQALIDAGYLVESNSKAYTYDFYQMPQKPVK